MRILLGTLNAKYVHSNLALKYLYGVASGSGLDVSLREFTINNDMGYIYTELVRGGYDLLCFSCYIWNIEQTKLLLAQVKQACPQIRIMLGGPEVSYGAKAFMEENPWVDYILRGEGENPFFQFCKGLVLEDEDLSGVPSLTWRRQGKEAGKAETILENPDGPLIPMEKVPFPYALLPMESDKVVYYESVRGCPYRCSYCLSSLEKTIRALPLERVRRELGYFLHLGVKQVKFIDRTFNYDRERARAIWRYLMENDNGVTNFHFEICGELLDRETVSLLSKARKGLFQFEIGIQSANPMTLAAVDRPGNLETVSAWVSALLAAGNIHIHLDLIAGLPYEDYHSFGRSFNQVYALGADNLQLGFLKLLKGTKIRGEAEEHDYVWRATAPYEVISNRYLSATDLVKLKMVENVLELYHNKGGFRRTLRALIRALAPESPFRFYEELADYFYVLGYQHRSHSKEDLYRILRAFTASKEPEYPGIVGAVEKLLDADLRETMNIDAVKKFYRKGWEI